MFDLFSSKDGISAIPVIEIELSQSPVLLSSDNESRIKASDGQLNHRLRRGGTRVVMHAKKKEACASFFSLNKSAP